MLSRLSTTSASPAHLKYLACWLAEWPLTSGWAPAFIRCPILCNRHSTVRSDRAPMLTGFTEAFRPLPIVKDSTRDWCQIYRPSTVVHKRTGAEIMARPVYTVSGQKSLRFSRHNFSKHYPIFELFTVTISLKFPIKRSLNIPPQYSNAPLH